MTLTEAPERVLALYFTSLLIGFLLGVIYDTAKAFRKRRKLHRVIEFMLTFFEDIVFFTFAGCTLAVIFFVYTYGRVRMFAVFMLALGFVLYRITLSRLVMKFYLLILDLVSKAVFVITLPITYPIKRIRQSVRRKRHNKMVKRLTECARRGFR